MTEQASTATSPALVIERVFDAPRKLVWRAWTEPEQMMKWWGPETFTSPVCEVDFRVGGKFLVSMRSPDFNDGKDIWSTGVYKEIVPLERIVCTDSFADEHGNVVSGSDYGMEGVPLEMLLTVTFDDLGGKTRLTLRHEGLPAGEHTEGANVGWNQSLDKLAALLAA
jgi:uncharacterized protein YndB with AHSA1/START domain